MQIGGDGRRLVSNVLRDVDAVWDTAARLRGDIAATDPSSAVGSAVEGRIGALASHAGAAVDAMRTHELGNADALAGLRDAVDGARTLGLTNGAVRQLVDVAGPAYDAARLELADNVTRHVDTGLREFVARPVASSLTSDQSTLGVLLGLPGAAGANLGTTRWARLADAVSGGRPTEAIRALVDAHLDQVGDTPEAVRALLVDAIRTPNRSAGLQTLTAVVHRSSDSGTVGGYPLRIGGLDLGQLAGRGFDPRTFGRDGQADRLAELLDAAWTGAPIDAAAHVGKILHDGASRLDALDRGHLSALLELPASASLGLARQLDGRPDAAAVLARSLDDPHAVAPDLRHYVETWRSQLDGTAHDATARAAEVARLAFTDRTKLPPDAWTRLLVLHDAQVAAAGHGLVADTADRPPWRTVLAALADGRDVASDDRDALASALQARVLDVGTDPAQRLALATRLVDTPPGQLDDTDVRRLRLLVELDSASDQPRLGRSDLAERTAWSFNAALASRSHGRTGELTEIQAAIRPHVTGALTTAQARREMLQPLLEAGAQLSSSQWITMRELVEAERSMPLLGLRIPEAGNPGQTFTELLDEHASRPNVWASGPVRSAIASWQLQLSHPDATVEQLRAYVHAATRTDPAQLTRRDWQLLSAIAAEHRLPLLERLSPNRASAGAVLLQQADADSVDPAAARVLDAWRLDLDGAVATLPAIEARFRQVLDGSADRPATGDELEQLLLLLVHSARHDGASPLHRARREAPLDALLGTTSRETDAHQQLRRHVEVARLELDGTAADPAALAATTRALLGTDTDTATLHAWMRLAAIGSLDLPPGRLPVTMQWPGWSPAAEYLFGAATSDGAPGHQTRAIAEMWRLELDDVLHDTAARHQEIRRIIALPAADVTAADRVRLDLLTDVDTGVASLGLAPLPGRSSSSSHTLDQKLEAFRAAWQRQLDPSLRDPQALRAELLDTLVPGDRFAGAEYERGARLQVLGRLARDVAPGLIDSAGAEALKRAFASDADDTLQRWRVALGAGFAVSHAAIERPDGSLPAHAITRSQVDAFLAGSKVPHTVFHGSSNRETWEHINERGPLVEKNKRSRWGPGFYMATVPGGWGENVHEVAIRTRNPLVVGSQDGRFHAALQRLEREHGAELDTRQLLLAGGYDSLIIQRNDDVGDWIIGLRNEDMRIVVADDDVASDVRPWSPRTYNSSAG